MPDLPYHRFERKSQRIREAPGKIGNKGRVVQGWDTGYPLRPWIGSPAIIQHLDHRLHQSIAEMTVTLVIDNELSPPGVTPTGQYPASFRAPRATPKCNAPEFVAYPGESRFS